MEKKLNKEQLAAIKHGQGPLLIIAGAGTGKTTVITERIKRLVLEENISPKNILALTFTDKAASEMEERVDVALPYGYTQIWISTFHAFCDRLLRNEAIHIGLSSSYKLVSQTEAILFLRKNIFKFDLDYFRPLGNPYKFLDAMLTHFSRLKDEDISPEDYLKFVQEMSQEEEFAEEKRKTLELANAFKIYEELKIKEGIMDFSDLISNTLKLLRNRKNLLTLYQEQFKYVLVDEFQDTNYAQNELAMLLAGQKKNITVVGDDDQAIYRWRGAAISNIIQFKKQFPEAKIITLTKNYRSTQEILDKSYRLIQNNNPDRLEVKEKVDKKLTSERNIKGDPIELILAARAEDEGHLVAEKIKEIIAVHPDINYKDIAVLVRANDHSNFFARAFERLRIPYQFLGPGQLFRQEEVRDLISYLRVLDNFEDSVSLYRVINIPIFDISPRDIAAILNFARKRNLTLFEAIENTSEIYLKDETKLKFKKVTDMINKHLKYVSNSSAGQILFYFLSDSGLLSQLNKPPQNQMDERRIQNISKLFDKLKAFELENEDSKIPSVVEWIDLSTDLGESPQSAAIDWSENDAVNILTVHSSKGLEFKVVFLVNLVTNRFPTRDRKEQLPIPQDLIKEILPVGDYHLEEERRLFYVGMTRTKDLLILTAAKFYSEGKRERKLSPFVYESLGERGILKKLNEKQKSVSHGQLNLLDWDFKEEEKIPEATKTLLEYLSYSQIQTFNFCPLHYKLRYILKIPVPSSASQSFGTSIHSTLRDFYHLLADGEKLEIKDSLPLLSTNWINEGYKSREDEKNSFKKAESVILDYLKNNFNEKNIPVAIEYPFSFNIDKLRIGGRIDRIDRLDGNKIEIIDYKTGSKVPSEKELSTDLQLTTYALAATEVQDELLGRKPDEVILSLHYLGKGEIVSTSRTKEQLEQSKELILQKALEISGSDFICSGTFCKNCEYKIICSSS